WTVAQVCRRRGHEPCGSAPAAATRCSGRAPPVDRVPDGGAARSGSRIDRGDKTVRLPFDAEDPPEEPPPGADRLSWQLAYALHEEHQPAQDGFCVAATCRSVFAIWPCPGYQLAAAGFLGSLGAW